MMNDKIFGLSGISYKIWRETDSTFILLGMAD